jgi:hypothetical protein
LILLSASKTRAAQDSKNEAGLESLPGAFSSEADAGSREENAANELAGAIFRFNEIGKSLWKPHSIDAPADRRLSCA